MTSELPRQHLSGLAGQTQRAAVSLATSISKAAARGERPEFIKSIHAALGWAPQLEYELLLATDLRLIEVPTYESMQALLAEVKKMLNGLSRSVTLQETNS